MKPFKLYIFILLNLFVISINAQHKKYNFKTVRLATNVLANNLRTKNYSISLYEHGLKIDSIFIEDAETIDVILKLNKVYTVEIAKVGFESRVFIVNTNPPDEIEKLNKKPQQLHVHLSHKGLNKSYNTNKDSTDELVIDNEGLMDNKSDQVCSSKHKSSSGIIYLP